MKNIFDTIKNKSLLLFGKWKNLTNFWQIVSLFGVIILISLIIAIPATISSLTKFTKEHQIAYDLVTTYYYDILDDHNLEYAENFKVKKCAIDSHEYSDYSFCYGWFYIEINNTYNSYYYMQLTSDGISDSLQKAPDSIGKNWDFNNSISLKPLNQKLYNFIKEINNS